MWLGNSSMLVAAGLALGLTYGGPTALLLIKHTVLSLAVFGMRRRSTWAAFAIAGLLCMPFGMLWLDWLTVVRNLDADPFYTLRSLPLVLVPIWGWLWRKRDGRLFNPSGPSQ